VAIENVSDEEIELKLSNLDTRDYDFIILEAAGTGTFVQFIYEVRGRRSVLVGEATSKIWLDPPSELSDQQVNTLEALGWEPPTKKRPNWSREFEATSREDFKEIVAMVRKTFQEAYELPQTRRSLSRPLRTLMRSIARGRRDGARRRRNSARRRRSAAETGSPESSEAGT
jgi:hypothetical protein